MDSLKASHFYNFLIKSPTYRFISKDTLCMFAYYFTESFLVLVTVLFFLVFCGNGDAYRDSSTQGKKLLVKYISSPFDYYFETEFC